LTAHLKRPFTSLDIVLLVIRSLILVVALAAYPALRAAAQSAVESKVAVDAQRITDLEKTNAVLVAENSQLQQRVSRIEGVGIGLGSLTGLQIFFSLMSHVSVSRKKRGA
jgi:hypothetical protein